MFALPHPQPATASLSGRFALAFAVAAIGFAPLGASPASAQQRTAQESCFPGGYWYLQKEGRGNAIAMACPGGASFEQVPAAASPTRKAMATTPEDCEPGGYWWIQTEEAPWTAVPMKCR